MYIKIIILTNIQIFKSRKNQILIKNIDVKLMANVQNSLAQSSINFHNVTIVGSHQTFRHDLSLRIKGCYRLKCAYETISRDINLRNEGGLRIDIRDHA